MHTLGRGLTRAGARLCNSNGGGSLLPRMLTLVPWLASLHPDSDLLPEDLQEMLLTLQEQVAAGNC